VRGGLGIISFSSFFVLRILCVKYKLEVCGRVRIHEFVIFLGRIIKGCKAFGGWGVDGATHSDYFDDGWDV
jgi:hypothetical protein